MLPAGSNYRQAERSMDGDSKQMKEEKYDVSLSLTLSLFVLLRFSESNMAMAWLT